MVKMSLFGAFTNKVVIYSKALELTKLDLRK